MEDPAFVFGLTPRLWLMRKNVSSDYIVPKKLRVLYFIQRVAVNLCQSVSKQLLSDKVNLRRSLFKSDVRIVNVLIPVPWLFLLDKTVVRKGRIR